MSNKQIDEYIYSLNYDPRTVLAFQGTKISNISPKEGTFENDKYVVVTREKCTIDSDYDVCITDENRNITYPGSLVYANEKLVDGVPTPIQLDRAPISVTMNLPGMTKDNYLIVQDVNYANISGAMNKIMDTWYNKYPDYNTIPADMSFTGGLVYDKNEMKLKFGCDVGFFENTLGINFDAVAKDEVSVYVAKYKQVFYTASVEAFRCPSEPFANHVTLDDLKAKNVNETQPPAYVNAVSYGREIYVKFESKCSKQTLSQVLDGSVSYEGITPNGNESGSIDNESLKIICSLVVLGGTPMAVEGLFSDKSFIDTVNKAIFSNTTLSKENPAYPLNYKVLFLKDNMTARFCGTSEYVKETSEVFSSGEIDLKHKGAYVAKFNISWQEIVGYNEDGVEITNTVNWDENDAHKTAGFQTMIPLKGNVRNINIKAQGATGLVWDPWHTPFDRNNITLVSKISLELSGTTLNQKANYEEIV
ncbi:MAG: thiol-activated cytolysin family protein [Acetatifactor sp.]